MSSIKISHDITDHLLDLTLTKLIFLRRCNLFLDIYSPSSRRFNSSFTRIRPLRRVSERFIKNWNWSYISRGDEEFSNIKHGKICFVIY